MDASGCGSRNVGTEEAYGFQLYARVVLTIKSDML